MAYEDYSLDQRQQYVDDIQSALQEASGFEREKLDAQMKSAQASLKNAMAIAKLQAETSRYGIDAQRQTALDQLKENQRQFDANHELDMAKFGLDKEQFGFDKQKFGAQFGLDYAKAATDYLSTPDRYAQGADFRDMAARTIQGLGPRPYGSTGDFTPKNPNDFAALASYYDVDNLGGGGNAPAGSSPTYSSPTTPAPDTAYASASGTPTASASGTATGASGQDPRLAALTSIIKAIPPSSDPGMDANDYAVLNAAKSLYSTNLRPGSLERMRPDQRAILSSYVKRSGRSWNDYVTDYQRQGVGQGSVRAA